MWVSYADIDQQVPIPELQRYEQGYFFLLFLQKNKQISKSDCALGLRSWGEKNNRHCPIENFSLKHRAKQLL